MDNLVRVYDIILDKNHRCCKTPTKNGCNADDIGTIYYTPYHELSPGSDPDCELDTAKPYHYNISQYPVKDELIYVKTSINFEYNTSRKDETYYFNPLGILQNASSNSYPNKLNSPHSENDYFTSKTHVKNLQPYEGDIIMQGRFGQSIRFGSTVNPTKVSKKNSWSNEGIIGAPITIITNGQDRTLNNIEENYEHTVENINNNDSSIWLCSIQQVTGFQVASTHDESYYYDKERSKDQEQINSSNTELTQETQEDTNIYSAEEIPPDELLETDELSDFIDSGCDYYDIALTEAQAFSTDSNITLPENYQTTDDVNDNYLNEEIG